MLLFVPLRLRLLVVAWPCVGASRAGSAPDFLPGGSGGGSAPSGCVIWGLICEVGVLDFAAAHARLSAAASRLDSCMSVDESSLGGNELPLSFLCLLRPKTKNGHETR